MKGKDKCKILKEIRAEIARANDIAWVTEQCTHKGECRGTCPKCESEVRALERALTRRQALGKKVAVVGLSAGMIATATACEGSDEYKGNSLDGDLPAATTTVTAPYVGTGEVDDQLLPPETELGGVPLPPKLDLGEVPDIPRYFLSDFQLYETEIAVPDAQSVVAYLVFEQDAAENGVLTVVSEGDSYAIIGISESMNLYLIRYREQYWAIQCSNSADGQ